MKITLVKKIKLDGSPCRKCVEVLDRLNDADQMKYIDEVLIADEGDENSPGMVLAQELQVERAPFFLVEHDTAEKEVYTVYFKFVKEVLDKIAPPAPQASSAVDDADELKEILETNPDLDYI